MNKSYVVVLALIIVILGGAIVLKGKFDSGETLKIGVITALTGDVSYLGQSSKVGADLAKIDLAKEGINVDLIFDDAQLDPKMALSAAQKQVNVDRVQAIYSEFNPAAVAVSSFIKDKNILNIYDAAPVSPLKESTNIYKTFIDFEHGCEKTAEYLKSKGVQKVGILQSNLEFGQLCTNGIVRVYGDNVSVETYNPGTTDFRTLLSKLKGAGSQVIFNGSFASDQIVVLQNMRGLKFEIPFAGLNELVTSDAVKNDPSLLQHVVVFGLPVASGSFVEKFNKELPGVTVPDTRMAAVAYIHLTQMARALHACGTNMECVRTQMDKSAAAPEIGFRGFKNHIADFEVFIEEFKDGAFVPVP